MKKSLNQKIKIPEGVTCTYQGNKLICKKDSIELSREITIPKTKIQIEENSITFLCDKANKKERKVISSFISHIKNMFSGLNEPYVYQLEACNVHFPMNLKVEDNHLTIKNFLGERISRQAEIRPNVEVKINGQKITVSSHNKEEAGQTAANFEKATKVKGRDRRIFQDGIYIVSKAGKRK